MKMKTSKKRSQNPWGLIFTVFILISVAALFATDSKNLILNKFLGIKNNESASKEFQIPTPTDLSTPTITPALTQYILKQTNRITPTKTISEQELIDTINIYRQAHGLSRLNTNESLCQETRKRVQDMINLNAGKPLDQITLNHDGMEADIKDGILAKLVGKSRYGENIAYAGCKRPADGATVDVVTGVQLVEWCLDSSPGHKANLLEPYWTDVCSSGQFPYYVETFAK